jgi:hypothetical protein
MNLDELKRIVLLILFGVAVYTVNMLIVTYHLI